PAGVVVQAFQVRNGRVVERIELGSDDAIVGTSDEEVLEAALQQFYELRIAPPEIHVPAEPDEREALESWLSARAGRKVHIVVPQRGEKRKLLEQGGPFPDLIVIDGGKGQLEAAYHALEELGLANLVAVGIAKKEELLYTREHVDPIALASNDPALLLIQQIRDEAHRFAV